MKLVSIELHHIGLYKDQSILFPYLDNDTILFWGNNGAGKTTLLGSIKIGLLGQKAFSSFEKYCDFVSNNLISSRWNRAKGDASIRISFEMTEDNEKRTYSILRKWSFENGVFSEDVSVFQRSNKLDFIQSERVLNKVYSVLPPSLMDVLIFDGENAINLLQKDQMPILVKNIIYSIFGMDIYSKMTKDLSLCLKSLSADSVNQADEIHSIETVAKYKQALASQRGYSKLYADTMSQKKAKQASLAMAIKRLSQRIGMDFNDIQAVKEDLSGMQDNRKKLQAEAKYVSEEILPLKILMPKFLWLQGITEKEQPYNVLQSIRALKIYFKDDDDSVSALADLEAKIQVAGDGKDMVGMTNADASLLARTIEVLKAYPKERLLAFISQKNSMFDQIKARIESIDKLSDPEALELLGVIETLSVEIDNLCAQIETLETQVKSSEEDLTRAKKEYDDLKKDAAITKKSSNAYVEITRYRESIEEFIEEKTLSICQELNKAIQKSLISISFRNGSIKRVEVDPKSFAISLYEMGGQLIPFSVFSAGEKQILLGLIIKESLRLSGIDGFFLFDTPVGRLDMSNRAIFTNEVIFKVAKQVMVFATDSDYSREDYLGIKHRLTAERTLTRNDEDQIVVTSGSIYGKRETKQ